MRALITSGGGAKGAFTVGALIYMIKKKGIDHFDIISGTSTGSLISSLLAIGKIDLLEEIYTSVNNNDILRQQDIVRNLKDNKPYIFDTRPLETKIRENIDDQAFQDIAASNTTLCLTAISLQTGRITVFCTKNITPHPSYDVRLITNREELINALLASSNQAAFTPPVKIRNAQGEVEQFVDGGNREVIPSMVVINQNPAPDEIYVLSNNPRQIEPVTKTYTNLLDVLMRAISIFIQDIRENDIDGLERFRTPGTAIHYIEPDRDLDPAYPTGLRFDPVRMGDMMAQGEREAERVLGPPIAIHRAFAPTVQPPVQPDTEDEAHQCTSMTEDGDRCKNRTRHPSGLCHTHREIV